MSTPTELADEVARLRACLNDLIGVAALPVLWTGHEPVGAVGRLADALLDKLGLAFVLVRLNETGREQRTDLARIAEAFHETLRPEDISEAIPTSDARSRPLGGRVSLGGTDFVIVSADFQVDGEMAIIIAGSQNPAFPSPTERFLLDVAATEAAIAVRQVRLLMQQQRAAEQLDERVAGRTTALAANEHLERDASEPRRWDDVESIPGMAATLTPAGEVEFVNRRMLEYVGHTFEQVKEWASNGTVHPEDRQRVVELNARSFAAGVSFDFEVRSRRFDGVYRWLESRVYPLRDGNGHIVRWYNLVIDIDERKRAEEAAAASERDLTLIINTIPALAWSARPDGSADFFNEHYLDFTGLTAQEAGGWGWTAAVHPDDLAELAETWQRIINSKTLGETEARLRRSDGTYRWFLFRANPLLDSTGTIAKWYGINTDIEDRKRVEAELRRAYNSFAEAQRLSKTGSFITDLVGDDHNWSEEAYRIFDFDSGSKVTVQRVRDVIHPDDLPGFESVIARGMTGVDVNFAFRVVTKHGAVKHVRGVAHVIERVVGRPMFVGALQDVTEATLAEEALNRARAELARVSRITTLSALTASIAHEVNQPLSGIVTNADTCLWMLDSNPLNVEAVRETVRRIIRDGNRAADVTARLRALFSKRAFTLERVDLTEAALEVVALSQNDLQRNRVVLESELAPDLPIAAGDRVQLQQVILNLLRNAVDAMIDVDDRPRRLLIRTEREGADRVRLTVRDFGVGLDQQTMNKLFDAFYTTKVDGMGIGLSISRSIVERHHGRLWVEPTNGPGTTFAFSIPCLGKSGADTMVRDEDPLMGTDTKVS
jgi:PAS domain S-box-containing protein